MQRRAFPLGGISLALAALACRLGVPSSGGGVDATLQAGVTQTLGAQPVAPTAQPTLAAVATEPPSPTTPPTDLPAAPATATLPPPSPTVSDPTRPNGAPIHAARLAFDLNVDGLLAEWGLLPHAIAAPVFQPENRSGPADSSGSFALAWDDAYLYLAVAIMDDVHVQTEFGETIFRGDSVELLLDARLQADHADARLSADDFQIGFSPGGLTAAPDPDVYLWFPQSRAGRPENIRFAFQPDGEAGYTLEAAVPWALFPVDPAPDALYGFAISASDNDVPDTAEQQSMISVVPTRRLADPTTWGTLVLDDQP